MESSSNTQRRRLPGISLNAENDASVAKLALLQACVNILQSRLQPK